MDEKIDQRIKNILSDLNNAQKRCEQFHAKQVNPGEKIIPMDIFEMGKAFDTRKKLYIELNLARAERYPGFLSEEKIGQLDKEKNRLEHNIRAYQNHQFPSQYRE
jgi:hypothetical protein